MRGATTKAERPVGASGRPLRRLLALSMAALLTAACTVAEQVAPEARLLQVADRMERVQTAHFTTEGRVTTQTVRVGAEPGGGEAQQPATVNNFAAEGEIQFPNRQRADVTLTDGGRMTTEVIRIGDDVWAYDPQRREWVPGQIDITSQLQQLDPIRTVGLLRAASREIRTVGEEQVNGAATTHYQAVLEPTAARQLLISGNPDLARDLERLEGTIDLWVSGDNLLRQVRPDLTFTLVDQQDPNNQRIRINTLFTMQFTDFDQPVNIQPPAAGTMPPGQTQPQPQPGTAPEHRMQPQPDQETEPQHPMQPGMDAGGT